MDDGKNDEIKDLLKQVNEEYYKTIAAMMESAEDGKSLVTPSGLYCEQMIRDLETVADSMPKFKPDRCEYRVVRHTPGDQIYLINRGAITTPLAILLGADIRPLMILPCLADDPMDSESSSE